MISAVRASAEADRHKAAPLQQLQQPAPPAPEPVADPAPGSAPAAPDNVPAPIEAGVPQREPLSAAPPAVEQQGLTQALPSGDDVADAVESVISYVDPEVGSAVGNALRGVTRLARAGGDAVDALNHLQDTLDAATRLDFGAMGREFGGLLDESGGVVGNLASGLVYLGIAGVDAVAAVSGGADDANDAAVSTEDREIEALMSGLQRQYGDRLQRPAADSSAAQDHAGVVATVGPQTTPGSIAKLIASGASLSIDTAQLGPGELAGRIADIYAAERAAGRRVEVMADVQGRPSIGELANGSDTLRNDYSLVLDRSWTGGWSMTEGSTITVGAPDYPQLDEIGVGDKLALGAGQIRVEVVDIAEDGKRLETRILSGGQLHSYDEIKIVGRDYSTTQLSRRERLLVATAAQLNVDSIAVPAGSRHAVSDFMRAKDKGTQVIAKIGTESDVADVDDIVPEYDVRAERDDLATAAGPAMLPLLMDYIGDAARAEGRRAFAAGGVLNSMAGQSQPTVPEILDVAIAGRDGFTQVVLPAAVSAERHADVAVDTARQLLLANEYEETSGSSRKSPQLDVLASVRTPSEGETRSIAGREERLSAAGATTLRFDGSALYDHSGRLAQDSLDSLGAGIERVRQARERTGRPLDIMVDAGDPATRTRTARDRKFEVRKDQELDIVEYVLGSASTRQVGLMTRPQWLDNVQQGEILALDRIPLEVLEANAGTIRTRVLEDGEVTTAMNLKQVGAAAADAGLTAEDREIIKNAAMGGADSVAVGALSVQQLQDLRRDLIAMGRGDMKVFAGLASGRDLEQLEDILLRYDGVISKRDELALTMGRLQLPQVQDRIVAAARKAEKPAILDGGVMERMTFAPGLPAAAEVSDAAYAIESGHGGIQISRPTWNGQDGGGVTVVEMLRAIAANLE